MNYCSADESGSPKAIFVLTNASAWNFSVPVFTDRSD
jgi:hypothetical protein